jgi:hypothetical protein
MTNLLCAQQSLALFSSPELPPAPSLNAPLMDLYIDIKQRETEEAKELVQRVVKALMVGVDGLIEAAREEQVEGDVRGVKRVMGEVGRVLGMGGMGALGGEGEMMP